MAYESTLVSVDHSNHGLYANTRIRERALNAAMAQADISRGFEEYLDIFNNFTPMTSKRPATPTQNQFGERRRFAQFSSTFWSLFTSWPKSAAFQYPSEPLQSLGMLLMRRILPGRSSSSARPVRPAQ
jgi:hypothetical protein